MVEDNLTIGSTKANYEPLCDIHFASFFLSPSIYIIGTWNIQVCTIMYPFFVSQYIVNRFIPMD